MSNIIIYMWLTFLKTIFTFLHIIYSGLQYFDLVWSLFKRKVEVLLDSHIVDTEVFVSRFTTTLEKCPRHLAIIVGNDEFCNNDFTNILLWSFAAGISFLTVYDHTGKLRENESNLYKYFLTTTKTIPGQITFRNLKSQNGVMKNGFYKKLSVSILSEADGKEKLIKQVKQYAEQIASGALNKSELSQDKISKDLEDSNLFPDPELVVICGNVWSCFGFPPWNIRVTEFTQVSTLENLQVKEFCDILGRYAACEQRLGK